MREYGAEHPGIVLPDNYFSSLEQYGHCTWLRSGREALYLVALNIRFGKDTPYVFMPAYCCHSMVVPFQKAGWKICYYALNEDLTVNIQYLDTMLLSVYPSAILTMNYFGCSSTKSVIDYIKLNCPECVIVEDFSHCTFSFDIIYNPNVDYYVSSIRKSIGVCDGSVIITNRLLNNSNVKLDVSDFVKVRKDSQILKWEYAYTQDIKQKNIFYPNLRAQEEVLDGFNDMYRISSTSMEMLHLQNGHSIRYARQKNMEHMLKILHGHVETVCGIESCLDGAPFSFPILMHNRDEKQKQLAALGVYSPVLWPISDEARKICAVASKMADKMLSIPIDQRYNYDDIEHIAQIVLKVCKI